MKLHDYARRHVSGTDARASNVFFFHAAIFVASRVARSGVIFPARTPETAATRRREILLRSRVAIHAKPPRQMPLLTLLPYFIFSIFLCFMMYR